MLLARLRFSARLLAISPISVAGKRRNRWDGTSALLGQSVVGRVRLSKLLVFFVRSSMLYNGLRFGERKKGRAFKNCHQNVKIYRMSRGIFQISTKICRGYSSVTARRRSPAFSSGKPA